MQTIPGDLHLLHCPASPLPRPCQRHVRLRLSEDLLPSLATSPRRKPVLLRFELLLAQPKMTTPLPDSWRNCVVILPLLEASAEVTLSDGLDRSLVASAVPTSIALNRPGPCMFKPNKGQCRSSLLLGLNSSSSLRGLKTTANLIRTACKAGRPWIHHLFLLHQVIPQPNSLEAWRNTTDGAADSSLPGKNKTTRMPVGISAGTTPHRGLSALPGSTVRARRLQFSCSLLLCRPLR
jgi:hypothetical protein